MTGLATNLEVPCSDGFCDIPHVFHPLTFGLISGFQRYYEIWPPLFFLNKTRPHMIGVATNLVVSFVIPRTFYTP